MVKKINDNNIEEFTSSLKGFEDIYEDFLDTEEVKEKFKKEREKEIAKAAEIYELQNFLEEENARLSTMDSFLTKKIPAKINFSQTERLIVEQITRKRNLKDRILTELNESESILHRNLARLFNSHFT